MSLPLGDRRLRRDEVRPRLSHGPNNLEEIHRPNIPSPLIGIDKAAEDRLN